ncbi:MAG: M28 family peptidase [Bacteroidota bacterium]
MKILIFVFLFFIGCEKQNDKVKIVQKEKQNIFVPKFDANRSWDYLITQTNFGPRNPNSVGHERTLQYLANELKLYADSISLQTFYHTGYNEQLRLTNIFASFNPQNKNRLLLLAHWDTRPRAENDPNPKLRLNPILGANDGASGVAVLLEIANQLKNNKLDFGVDILLVDGEDYGKPSDLANYSIGAKHFVKTKSPTYQPKFAILLDMVGDADLQIPIEINSLKFAPKLIQKIWNIAEELNVHQFVKSPGNEIYDDHISLNESGIPTIDIIDFDYPNWHTSHDAPKSCSKNSLDAVGKVLLNFIYNLPFDEEFLK